MSSFMKSSRGGAGVCDLRTQYCMRNEKKMKSETNKIKKMIYTSGLIRQSAAGLL